MTKYLLIFILQNISLLSCHLLTKSISNFVSGALDCQKSPLNDQCIWAKMPLLTVVLSKRLTSIKSTIVQGDHHKITYVGLIAL